MALALDAESHGSANATSLTVSHTCSGQSRVLTVMIALSSGSDLVTGVTYNGIAMTRAGYKANSGPNEGAYIYYLFAPATGANSIVISASSSSTIKADNASFTGVAATVPITATSSPSGVSTCANTITTVTDNSVHVAAYNPDSFGVASVTNGTLVTSGNSIGAYSNPVQITPAGSNSLTANSGGNNNWCSVGAVFAPGIQTVIGLLLSDI